VSQLRAIDLGTAWSSRPRFALRRLPFRMSIVGAHAAVKKHILQIRACYEELVVENPWQRLPFQMRLNEKPWDQMGSKSS